MSADPPVEVIPCGLNDSTVDLKLRWWSSSPRLEQVQVKGRVILAVAKAAKDHGVDLPFPTSVVLFHDQTEEVDGDRRRQREGWPAGKHPPQARAAVIVAPPTHPEVLDEATTKTARRPSSNTARPLSP